jgi:class 3 adenylate cyclase
MDRSYATLGTARSAAVDAVVSSARAEHPRAHSIGWIERLDDILDWSTTDKVLILGLVVGAFAVWWTFVCQFVSGRPDLFPYVNVSAMGTVTWLLRAVSAGFAVLCIAAWIVRRRQPNSRALVYGIVVLYAALSSVASYALGLYTNVISGVLIIGGFAVGLVLFDRRPVLLMQVLTIGLAVAFSVTDQVGLLPYAPVFRTAPFENGRLDRFWLILIGTSSLAAMSMFMIFVYVVIRRWQDREQKLARAHAIIARYVPSQVALQIHEGQYSALERHVRRKVTVLFADLQGFAAIADTVDPEDLSTLLNAYLAEMSAIGERHGGTIDKFVGDAIMVYFGAPVATNDRDHASRAVRTAIDMQRRLVTLREQWEQDGFEFPVHVRIGINTGHATIGAFGSAGRMDYTAIGRHVNLASRIQAHCEPDQIFLTRATWLLVRDHVGCDPVGEIQVKGFQHPISTYRVELGAAETVVRERSV